MGLSLFFSKQSIAQDNTGTEFWFTVFAEQFLDHYPGVYVVGNYDATVTIDYVARDPAQDQANDPQCTRYTFNLVGGQPQFVDIPYDLQVLCFRYYDDFYDNNAETIQQNGIRVTSTAPIAIYSQFFTVNSSEMTAILPVNQLGQDYIVSAHREITNEDNDFNARTTIVATENNTNVTIALPNYTWTSKIIPGVNVIDSNILSRPPGSTWTVTLDQGETYTFISNDNSDTLEHTPLGSSVTVNNNQGLSGVRITSDRPISVLGGTDCTWIGNDEYPGCGACDLTTTHLKPVNNWGTSFVTTQTLVRPSQMSLTVGLSGTNNGTLPTPNIEPYPGNYDSMSVADYLLITARNNGTVVNIDGNESYTKTLSAGEWFIFESPGISNPFNGPPATSPGAAHHTITSNSPIQVVQMMKGWQCDNVQAADPSQMLVLEEGSWADNYIVTNPTQYANNFFVFLIYEPNGNNEARSTLNLTANGNNVAIPTGMSATGDGTNGWTAIGNTGYFFQRVNVTSGIALRARSLPQTPGGPTYNFGFYASGSSNASSYGYMGGAVCQLEVFASASLDTVCEGSPITLQLDSTRNGGTVNGNVDYDYSWEVVDAGGNIVYSFNGTGNNVDHTFNAVAGGELTAYLELSDNADCFATDSVKFFVNLLPDIDDQADYAACNSATLPAITGTQLSGNQAYYDAPNGTGAFYLPGDVINQSTTLYMFDESAPGCSDEEDVVITINGSPVVDPASIVRTCNGAGTGFTVTFEVTGGDGGPYTVNENAPGGIGGSFNGNVYTSNEMPNGSLYDYDISDANGCAPAVVSGGFNCNCISDAGTMNTTPISTCGNGTQMASGGTVAPTLDADDAESFVLHDANGGTLGNVTATNTTASFAFDANNMTYGTTYYISRVVGDDDGTGLVDLTDLCLSVAVGTPVVWNEPVTVALTTTTPEVCDGDAGSIDFTMTGPGPFNIVYNDGNSNQNILNTGANTNETVTPQGATTYTVVSVTSTDNGCSADLTGGAPSVQIDVNGTPLAQNIVENCDASNLTYTVSFDIVDGEAPYTVNVTQPNGIGGSFNGATWTSDPINSGDAYNFELSDANACGVTTVSGQNTCVCISDAGGMNRALNLRGCGVETLSSQVDLQNQPTLDGNDAYEFILHDQGGNTLGTVLNRSNQPSFTFDPNTMTYGVIYYISAVVGNDMGGGQVDLNDQCLSVSFGAPVVWYEIPDAAATYNGPLCTGEELQLFGSNNNGINGVTYAWDNGNGFVSTEQNPVLADVAKAMNGQITLTVDNQGCSDDVVLNLEVNQQATAGYTYALTGGNNTPHQYTFTNGSQNAGSYDWDFGDGNVSADEHPTHQFIDNGEAVNVRLVALGEGGCNDTLFQTFNLIFNPDTVLIFVPNAFTPDGNEFNQEFKPVFNEEVDASEYNLKIFNRWGELIFESSDLEIGWDGSYQDARSPSGVYSYIVKFRDRNSSKNYSREGTVTVLR